jgi:hypothetical protein
MSSPVKFLSTNLSVNFNTNISNSLNETINSNVSSVMNSASAENNTIQTIELDNQGTFKCGKTFTLSNQAKTTSDLSVFTKQEFQSELVQQVKVAVENEYKNESEQGNTDGGGFMDVNISTNFNTAVTNITNRLESTVENAISAVVSNSTNTEQKIKFTNNGIIEAGEDCVISNDAITEAVTSSIVDSVMTVITAANNEVGIASTATNVTTQKNSLFDMTTFLIIGGIVAVAGTVGYVLIQRSKEKSAAMSAQSGRYGVPSGGYGAPSGGYGAPSGGYGAPSGGYGAPSGGYGAPSGGYGAPSGGHGAPSSGYGAPSSGYGAPSSGYGAPSSGPVAPSGGYGAPSSGPVAPSGGYGAPSSGPVAPSGGYGAPSSGPVAPSGGYGAPSSGPVAPSGGYGAPSSGFVAPSGGYGAPSGGYGAPSGGYGGHGDLNQIANMGRNFMQNMMSKAMN